MVEVGQFTSPKTDSQYAPGQFFIHAELGYRGVVVCPVYPWVSDEPPYAYQGAPADEVKQAGSPWGHSQAEKSNIHTAALGNEVEKVGGSDDDDSDGGGGGPQGSPDGRHRRLWYQVLRDDRDHDQPRHQYALPDSDMASGLSGGGDDDDGAKGAAADADCASDSDSLMRAVYNFEYVAHSDLLPYIPHNSRRSVDPHATAFRNPEFNGLFHTVSLSNDSAADRGNLAIARESLSEWFNTMSTVLRDVSISSTTTIEKNAAVRVSVLTVFNDASEGVDGEKRWTWFNRVTLHNLGTRAIQVYGRHLEESEIRDGETVDTRYSSGKGVVGVMPIVAGKTSFWFLSNVQLGRASGSAGGHYHALVMQDNDQKATREHFDLHIPDVKLSSPVTDQAADGKEEAGQGSASANGGNVNGGEPYKKPI